MKRQVDYIVVLPRHIKVVDISTKSIPIDDNWETIVKENGRVIGHTRYGIAREKYG
jgi:hypothetical protein